jgi:hypothetical protein
MAPKDAEAKVERDVGTVLPDGLATPRHDTIALNVWGANEVARGLYSSLGWAEESVHMRKRL